MVVTALRSPRLSALSSAALLAVAARPWGPAALAWVALVPLFVVLPRSRSRLGAAGLAGLAALGVTVPAYEAAAALGRGWHLLAVVVAAAPFALAGAGAWTATRNLRPGSGPFVLALFWALAEFVPAQPALLGRFALVLSTLGYSQAGQPAMHLARFSSVTATSVALLLANALLAHALTRAVGAPAGARLHAMAGSLVGTLLLAGLVAAAWATAPRPTGGTFHVAVVQPDRPTALLASASRVPEARDQVLRSLVGSVAAAYPEARRGAAPGPGAPGVPDLVVLPEGAWPHAISVEAPLSTLPAASLAALEGLPTTLLGAPGLTARGGNTNSAFLWAHGALEHAYAKLHLVPVGEAALEVGAAASPVQVPTSSASRLSVAPSICYDVAFAATARRAVLAGAQLIAVLTNDAFAARGDVPHQHLRLARFRAVESGTPLAFASNTGPSALIRADGALAAVSSAGQATVLRGELGVGAGPTPYVRYGNWVGALMCLTAVLFSAMAAVNAAGKRGGEPSAVTSAT